MHCPTCNQVMVKIGKPYRSIFRGWSQRYRCPRHPLKADVLSVAAEYTLPGTLHALHIEGTLKA